MAAEHSRSRSETAQTAEDERDRLMRAAMDVLQRNGWWGFKVESVLRQAGLSTRSFYRHFERKSDLLVALLEQELGGLTVYLRRMTAAASTPSDKVRAFVSAGMDMAYEENLAKPASLFALHWREMLAEYPDTIERCADDMTAPLLEAIQEGNATGEFRSEDPVADARAVFYLVAGATADQAAVGGATPREQLAHVVLPFIERVIGLR